MTPKDDLAKLELLFDKTFTVFANEKLKRGVIEKIEEWLLEARVEELQKLPKLCLIDKHKLSDHIEELKALGTNR